MTDILDAIKGFGGYTTTLSLWIIAFITAWKGLPALLEAGNKIVDAIANRQSAIEERMRALLADADRRLEDAIKSYEHRLKDALARHDECMAGQERMHREIMSLRDRVEAYDNASKQRGLSLIRVEGLNIPGDIVDAAERAANALDQLEP